MEIENSESGIWRQQLGYKSFSPAPINHAWSWRSPDISTLLEQATLALGQLDAYTRIVPDVDQFIRMHVLKEANQSSRIEGTQTNIEEALLKQEQIQPERRDDWQEVQNYIAAMNLAIDQLQRLPLSNRLLKDTHARLMQGVRGDRKSPGEFRRSQNWIGGSSLANAVFIPPQDSEVAELMSDLEKFWHNGDIQVPHLIRIAISHYQFETIHPFLDGNGRIGRLLVTLYLMDKRYLGKPSLYLSDFFERHRGAYYDALSVVRASNDLLHWIRFFLTAVAETAASSRQAFERILDLRQSTDHIVLEMGRRTKDGMKLLRHLFQSPAVTSADVQKVLDCTPKTANAMIEIFIYRGLLRPLDARQRNRIFLFDEYLNLFRTPS